MENTCLTIEKEENQKKLRENRELVGGNGNQQQNS